MLSRSSAAVSKAAASRLPLAPAASAAFAARTATLASTSTSTSTSTCPTCWRHLSSTSSARLPRQLGRQALTTATLQTKSEAQLLPDDVHQPNTASSSDPNIPWFLEAEQIDPPDYSPEPSQAEPSAAPSDSVPAVASGHFDYIPESASTSVPNAVVRLQDHLLHGPASNLLARPPSKDEDLPAPISFIHPYSLSADPSNDAYGKTDYIVIVQVKSSAAGSVRKVAQSVGNFLKHQPPPPVEPQAALGLDDLLGPDRSKDRHQRTSDGDVASKEVKALSPRPKGMSRIEHELGKKLPDWAVHRIALSRKFPDGWKPPKILSREAQDGLRLLHGSDPERFDIEELAARFRISKESVRRILKGGKWKVSSETRARQDQRAKERIAQSIYSRPERWSREESELAEIRRLQEEGSELVEDGESPIIEGEGEGQGADEGEAGLDGAADADAALEKANEQRPVFPVRYEGLVVGGGEGAGSAANAKGPSKNSPVSRGNGHWCLVDAGWCMVHVMTEQARFKYDIEGMWREIEAETEVTSVRPRGYSLTSDAATSTARVRKSIFGQNINARPRPAKFGDTFKGKSRTFATSSHVPAMKATNELELPETLNQTLVRCYRELERIPKTTVPVVVHGWLRSTRKQKHITFLQLTDGSLKGGRALQAIYRHNGSESKSEGSGQAASPTGLDTSGLTIGTALRLEGRMKLGRGSLQGQDIELDVERFEIVGQCDATYPLAVLQHEQQVQNGRNRVRASSSADDGEGQAASSASQTSLAERRESHLRGRLPRHAATLRVRQLLEDGMAEWFQRHDFTKVTCPILTSSNCEGAGEVFQVVADSDVRSTASASPSSSASPVTMSESQGQPVLQKRLSAFWSSSPAYLTVSSQLHLEAVGLGLSRVWTLNPAFRAEGSATNRHLAEFWMLEAEMYWTAMEAREGSSAALGRLIDCCEGVVKAAMRRALDGPAWGTPEDITYLLQPNNDVEGVGYLATLRRILDTPRWTRITYTDAIELLRKKHFEGVEGADAGVGTAGEGYFAFEPVWGEGLASEHERYLASSQVFDGPVFVTDFPRAIKAFYMRSNASDADLAAGRQNERETVACFDLLIPKVGELVGGSLREERQHVLEARLPSGGVKAALEWYTDDLRRYGGAPHGGFGLGVERLVSWITNTENVRDVNTFARTKGVMRF
ncbi:asparaginyl-tRNA synthetase [Thecaphora frezii]